MKIEKQFIHNINQNNNIENYYYMPNNQQIIEISETNSPKNSRNSEPQDNIKKSKRRRLLEMENKLKDNENYFQNFITEESQNNSNDKSDNKSLTAIKGGKMNKIFQKEIEQKNNEPINNKNNNINIIEDNIIINKNEKQNKINELINNSFNMISPNNLFNNNYNQQIFASPKINRKQNLSNINALDINMNMNTFTSRYERFNNFEEDNDYKYKERNDDILEYDINNQNKNINDNSNYINNSYRNNRNNIKRIKSLNRHNQNKNNKYKRINSARHNNQNISIQSTSSDNNNNKDINL